RRSRLSPSPAWGASYRLSARPPSRGRELRAPPSSPRFGSWTLTSQAGRTTTGPRTARREKTTPSSRVRPSRRWACKRPLLLARRLTDPGTGSAEVITGLKAPRAARDPLVRGRVGVAAVGFDGPLQQAAELVDL